MTVPDRDRQRVYDAEVSALGGTVFDDPLHWDDVLALFHRTIAPRWWQELGVPTPVLRRARSDAQRSSSDGTSIRIARHGQNALTLAHELSHHVVQGLALVDPGHGPAFRACSLRIIELTAGTEARRFLSEAWHDAGLAVDPWPRPEPPHGPGIVLHASSSAIPLGPVPA